MNTSTSNLPTIIFLLLLCFGFKSFSQTSPPSPHTHGQWSPVIEFDIVPVAIANLPDGRLVTWSSKYHDDFDMNDGYTFTQIFDPALGDHGGVLARTVTETYHDMFCPGINNLADGRLLVTGGSSDEKTSIYDPKTGIWTADDNMKVARGYQGAVTLADGSAFTIGGSWNDGVPAGGRDGEIWRGDAAEGQRWTHLTGLPGSILYNQNDIDGEPEGVYRLDNHAWLFAAPNGKIFHAGPGETMHWIDVSGSGSSVSAGQRAQDYMAMNGGAAMFDIGKILKVGGSASYSSNTDGNPNTYVIDINNENDVTVTRITDDMEHARIYVSTVVLPNGEVLVLGGLDHAEVFVDDVAYLSAEMFTPDATGNNGTFRTLASMEVPRTYHSAAILLKDGRVFMGGGGLCGEGCAANHKDAEIYSPPYLFNSSGILAERPRLKAPDKAFYERPLTVTASPGIQEFSFMRMSSATHSVNNEQRRVPVIHTEISPGNYQLTIPQANLMPPGYYMLFAIDAAGVPSIAETVLIGAPDSRLNGENLLVEYDFFEGTGTLIRDTSGNDNHGGIIEHDNNGTSINPPTGDFWSADGLSGNALEMDGMEFNSNSIVEISNSSTIGEALTDQITVMAWVNRNVDSRLPDGKIPNVAVFTHLGELSSGYSSFFLGYHADAYKLEFFTEGGGSAVIYRDEPEHKRYTPGVWEHLVGTYDGTTATLYVNGEVEESVTVSGNLIINTTESLKNAFTLSGFYELRDNPGGTAGNSSGITDELDGRMDKFKLYNIALTIEEIQAIYNEEYKVVVEPDPCDDYYLVYEIGENSGSGSKEISIREGDSIRLTLNDESVNYIVRDPNGDEILDGVINNITVSGDYTVTAMLDELETVQGVTIHNFCSEQTGLRDHSAGKAIDESIMSYWHTLWSGDQGVPGSHNHFIDLDLGVETPVFELRYLPRPANDPEDAESNWLNGTIIRYNIYVSSTTDSSGEVIWGSLITTGVWDYNHDLKTANLGGVVGRYVRLEALETRDNEGSNSKYASAADIKVMTSKECVNDLKINVVVPKTYIFDDNTWVVNGDPSGDPSGNSNEFDDIEILSGDAVISKSTSARNITIAAGAALTVDPEAAVNLSIRNRLTLNSTSTSYASLIENGYLTGTVFYNRYVNKIGTSAGGGNDLISSPLTMVFDAEFVTENQGVLAEHSETSGIFAFAPYNVTTGKYENFNIGSDYSGKIPLVSGAGYRAATVNGEPLQFKGKTNKNAVSIPISDAPAGNAWNLIGNPYPSYLDFEMFITENASQLNADSDGAYQAVYGYTGFSNTWTVWNQALIEDSTVTTSIAPGQGFFVNAKQGGGIIRFTPEMRITGNTDDFIDGRPSKNIALSKLKLSDSQKSDVTSIYFIDGTTRGLDRGYDAGTFTGVARDFLIYTNLVEDHSGTNIAIQSLPYDDFNEVTVPLGIKAKAGAELSISIDSLSTIPSTINVYLEDKQENTMVLLNKGSYTFTSTVELNTAERFNIHYSSKPLSIDNLPSNDNIRIYVADAPKSIMILGQLKSATTASVYDLHGRMVLSKALNANSTENAIDVSTISTGVYILRLGNDHQVKTQKVIIK